MLLNKRCHNFRKIVREVQYYKDFSPAGYISFGLPDPSQLLLAQLYW